jgi:nicotinate-nucleotide pyrophosphorylase (carboxylating)
VTTRAVVPPGTQGRARMVFREAGVICGLQVAQMVFWELAGEGCERTEQLRADGEAVEAGATVMEIAGSAEIILTAERVALNFAQRLSGIATLTRCFVEAIEGTNARITDTRKTTPGLRLLEKYAVRCGGGVNHRFALDDMVLIKDNHIALCGGVTAALERARQNAGHAVKIEIECDTLEQVREAANAGADVILLDNMPPGVLREAVQTIAGRAVTEASGGVNLGTVRAIAESGVDVISVGALTHSARALDIGLDVELR